MKRKVSRLICMVFLSGVLLASCGNKNNDKEIEASIVEKTSTDPSMSGLTASVKDGVVTLNGQCKDENCKTQCAQSVKSIKGVKEVVNNITLAAVYTPPPVEISPDATLKTSVDSVLSSYSGVTADITAGIVTLRGQVKRSDLQNLMQAVNSLKPKKVENQLVINK